MTPVKLYVTTFLCGASVMGVELCASRFIAPYYGSSMITWTIIIGVILLAISLGNFTGGILADRPDPAKTLYRLIWWASIWIACIPLIGKYLIASSLVFFFALFPDQLVLMGSLFSCLALFAFPCYVLGATSPCLVRIAMTNLETAGKTTGAIYAFSTVGSIVGTFLPTFVTIPLIGTMKSFFLFALVLNLLASSHFIAAKCFGKRALALLILLLLFLLAPIFPSFAFWKTMLVEDESIYNYLQVYQEGESAGDSSRESVVALSTHVVAGWQSTFWKNRVLTGQYYDLALFSPFFRREAEFTKPLDVLVIGFGAGSFPKVCKRIFPNAHIEGVEIDAKIVDLARKHFEFSDTEARVHIEDGRLFLAKNDKRYDVIFIDAYQDITIPFHLVTVEFFELVKSRLKDDGIVSININLHGCEKPDLSMYIEETLKKTMARVYRCNHVGIFNTILFASQQDDCLKTLTQNLTRIPPKHPLHQIAQVFCVGLTEVTETALMLTDDRAPVEMLGFKLLHDLLREGFREAMVRLLSYVKDSV